MEAAPDRETFGGFDDEFFANARVRKGDRVIREATSTLARRGRPPKAEGEKKEAVSIRLSPQVLAYFRRQGDGWQTRIDELLTEFVEAMGASESGHHFVFLGTEHVATTNFNRVLGVRGGNVNIATALGNAQIGNLVVDVHGAVEDTEHNDLQGGYLVTYSSPQRSGGTLFERMSAIAKGELATVRSSGTGEIKRSARPRTAAKRSKKA
jgi:uncharacterized protein (DUF4415 family)